MGTDEPVIERVLEGDTETGAHVLGVFEREARAARQGPLAEALDPIDREIGRKTVRRSEAVHELGASPDVPGRPQLDEAASLQCPRHFVEAVQLRIAAEIAAA